VVRIDLILGSGNQRNENVRQRPSASGEVTRVNAIAANHRLAAIAGTPVLPQPSRTLTHHWRVHRTFCARGRLMPGAVGRQNVTRTEISDAEGVLELLWLLLTTVLAWACPRHLLARSRCRLRARLPPTRATGRDRQHRHAYSGTSGERGRGTCQRTLHRECLDHIVVPHEQHLRSMLTNSSATTTTIVRIGHFDCKCQK
jgi:hypothetical protein